MFSKISRYRKLPDVVLADVQGRRVASKSLRPLPKVTGTFLHTVEDGDRLDQLAYKYYSQPRNWWRICDANPEFLSPLALLGTEPLVTARFSLTFSGAGQPKWSDLLKSLSECLGVVVVRFTEDVELDPPDNAERYVRAAIVTYNQMNTGVEELAALIEAAGFGTTPPERIGRVGKPIVIPPGVVG